MTFDPLRVRESFAFNAVAVAALRRQWLELMDLCVFGDVRSSKIGSVDRLRKRLLETGEGLRSLTNDRSWIPQLREQVKGAMGATIKLRDILLGLDRAAQTLDGGADFQRFEKALLAFRHELLRLIEHHENQWASLLEEQYETDEPGDDEPD